MQTCSSSHRSLCSLVCFAALILQQPWLSSARPSMMSQIVQSSAHADTRASPEADKALSNPAVLEQTPGIAPVCSMAYADLQHFGVRRSSTSWGQFVSGRIAGVVDPLGQHVVIGISGIAQNQPACHQRRHGSSPDAQINGLNHFLVRYEHSETNTDAATVGRNGRMYSVSYVATNESGFSCEGSVAICIPSHGQKHCQTHQADVMYDSTVCSSTSDFPQFSMD